jgi:hypothetical protein
MTRAPTITPIVRPVADEEVDEPAAASPLGFDVTAGFLLRSTADTRGDGFTEDVGVGDTGTAVGSAAAVAVGLVRVRVGVGVDECVGVGDDDAPRTVIVPVMYV